MRRSSASRDPAVAGFGLATRSVVALEFGSRRATSDGRRDRAAMVGNVCGRRERRQSPGSAAISGTSPRRGHARRRWPRKSATTPRSAALMHEARCSRAGKGAHEAHTRGRARGRIALDRVGSVSCIGWRGHRRSAPVSVLRLLAGSAALHRLRAAPAALVRPVRSAVMDVREEPTTLPKAMAARLSRGATPDAATG